MSENGDPTAEVMNKHDVSALLQVSPATVDRLRIIDGLPFMVVGRRCIRFLRADIMEWLSDKNRGRK